MAVHIPDLAAVLTSLLSSFERDADPSDPVQVEAMALLRRAVVLLERKRTLMVEQAAIEAELEKVADRLQRLDAAWSALSRSH